MESSQSVFLRYNFEESYSPLNNGFEWHRNTYSQASLTNNSQPGLYDLQDSYLYGQWNYRHAAAPGALLLYDPTVTYINQQASEEENESSLSSQSPQQKPKDELNSLFGDPSVLINKLMDELEDGVSMSPFNYNEGYKEFDGGISGGGFSNNLTDSSNADCNFVGINDEQTEGAVAEYKYDVSGLADQRTVYSPRNYDSKAAQQQQSNCNQHDHCNTGNANIASECFPPIVGNISNGSYTNTALFEEGQSSNDLYNINCNGAHKQSSTYLKGISPSPAQSTTGFLRDQDDISQSNTYSSVRIVNGGNATKERVRRSNRSKPNRSTRVANSAETVGTQPQVSLDYMYATEHGIMLKAEALSSESIDADSDEYESDLENLLKQMDRREYQDSWSKDWTLGLIRFCKYMQLSEKMQMGPVMKLPQDDNRCVINVMKKIYQLKPPAGWPCCGVRLQIHCGGYLQDILAWSNINRAMWLLIMPLVEKGISLLIKKVGGVQKLRNGHQPYFNACRNALRENNTLHACLKDYSRSINTSKRKHQLSNSSFKEAANEHEHLRQQSSLKEAASDYENLRQHPSQQPQ